MKESRTSVTIDSYPLALYINSRRGKSGSLETICVDSLKDIRYKFTGVANLMEILHEYETSVFGVEFSTYLAQQAWKNKNL